MITMVHIECNPVDARWIYYSINVDALQELSLAFGAFFQPERIKPRRLTCGPGGQFELLQNLKLSDL